MNTSSSRTYNIDNSGLFVNRKDRCAVSVKNNGFEVGMISFKLINGNWNKLASAGNISNQDLVNARTLVNNSNL